MNNRRNGVLKEDEVIKSQSVLGLRGPKGEAEPAAPAWLRINRLFQKHGLPVPPTRLRDELVAHLLAYEGTPL